MTAMIPRQALLAILLTASVAAAAEPPLWLGMDHLDEWSTNIRTNQSLRTWNRFRLEHYEPFLRREIVQPYLDFSADRGTERLVAGSNLLERLVSDITFFRSLGHGIQTKALIRAMRDTAEDGASLVADGSDWPLFRIMAHFRGLGNDELPNLHALLETVGRIPATPSHAFVRALGAGLLWSAPEGGGRRANPLPSAAWGVCAECVIHWLNHREFSPEEARPLLLALELTAQFPGSAYGEGNTIVVPEIVAHCPNLDPWIRELVAGMLAWRSEEKSPEAKRANDAALAHFDKAWHLHPEYPEAAFQLLYRSMNNCGAFARCGLPGAGAWFDRVQKAEVDFLPAYRQYAFALSPIWGGRTDSAISFADSLVKAKRPDLLFPIIHANILALALGGTHLPMRDLFIEDGRLDSFKAALAEVAESPSCLRDAPLVAAFLLAAAEFTRGDADETRRWARKLAPDDFATGSRYAFTDTGEIVFWGPPGAEIRSFELRNLFATLGGDNGERLLPLVKLLWEGRRREFLAQLAANRERGLSLTAMETAYIGKAETEALAKAAVEEKTPVHPRFDPHFSGWETSEGWVFDDSDGISGFAHTNKVNANGRITWRGPLPTDIRISGHLQFPVSNACLLVYLDWRSDFETESPVVAFLRGQGGVFAQAGNAYALSGWNSAAGSRWGVLNPPEAPKGWRSPKPPKKVLPDAPGISSPLPAGDSREAINFEVEAVGGNVTVRIDGKTVIADAPLGPLYDERLSGKPVPVRFRGNGVKISSLTFQSLQGEKP